MRTNTRATSNVRTHNGAPAIPNRTPYHELRRSVLAAMLFENTFYETGNEHAARVAALIPKCTFEQLAELTIHAREQFKLRHMPLFIIREMLRNFGGRKMGDLIHQTIQRVDEAPELLAMYWAENPNAPVPRQLKVGLARAIKKFNAHQLAKYNRDGKVKLRDVLHVTHARPNAAQHERYTKAERKRGVARVLNPQEALFKSLIEGTIATADTWESALSGGADKKETFTRLMGEKKLGALALLRNLRGMQEAGVDEEKIRAALLSCNVERVLPFRFITAARYAPKLEDVLEQTMFRCIEGMPKLPGRTAILLDHSGSMRGAKVSDKSEIDRWDAACGLAMLARELCERVNVFVFSDQLGEVPPRRGFGLRDQLTQCMGWGGTYLGGAIRCVNERLSDYDRIIVFTDEQSNDHVGGPLPGKRGYMVNVATYANGVGFGDWTRITGFSEAILDYIRLDEELEAKD